MKKCLIFCYFTSKAIYMRSKYTDVSSYPVPDRNKVHMRHRSNTSFLLLPDTTDARIYSHSHVHTLFPKFLLFFSLIFFVFPAVTLTFLIMLTFFAADAFVPGILPSINENASRMERCFAFCFIDVLLPAMINIVLYMGNVKRYTF